MGAGKARARVLGRALLGRALLAQRRPRPPAPRPPGPAPGSILQEIGLGCDAALGRQVRSGSLPPCAPRPPRLPRPGPLLGARSGSWRAPRVAPRPGQVEGPVDFALVHDWMSASQDRG